ncbi:MAG: Zn-ribbon domain-containing OB-fold protein [Candidatus Acidiferrales bacterium]
MKKTKQNPTAAMAAPIALPQSAATPPPTRASGVWPGSIPLESFYTAGLGGQIFFQALKERGELVGTRCKACKQVYVPARVFCERCFVELSEQVKVKPEGTLASFTFSFYDRDGARLAEPLVLGLVKLEGATTVLLHRLLKVNDPARVRIGARVKAVIKPKMERAGSILDIDGFVLE